MEVASFILLVIGGIIGLYQWYKSVQIRRAEFVNQIIEKLRFDTDMSGAMNIIEYTQNWYNEKFHNEENSLEPQIDKLFSYISYICYLKKSNIIKDEEFKFVKYKISITCYSFSTQKYLWNIYHFAKSINSNCSFEHLIQYGLENSIISEELLNKESEEFLQYKYLNF